MWAAASPAWSQAAQAGLGVACWARRCLVEAGLTVLDGVPRLPAVPDAIGAVHLREGLDSPDMNELADMITAAVADGSDAGYRDLARRAAAGLESWVRQQLACANPERCAQRVVRASSIAIRAYITMPSTASASSPAKISGT